MEIEMRKPLQKDLIELGDSIIGWLAAAVLIWYSVTSLADAYSAGKTCVIAGPGEACPLASDTPPQVERAE
jgi:hypothetical protein